MTREDIIDGYMINKKHVIAEMLYDTITKYENRIAELEAPKSCEGCKYENGNEFKFITVVDETLECCHVCERGALDYYEPKDK